MPWVAKLAPLMPKGSVHNQLALAFPYSIPLCVTHQVEQHLLVVAQQRDCDRLPHAGIGIQQKPSTEQMSCFAVLATREELSLSVVQHTFQC